MKKKLIATLLLAFLTGIANTSLAATSNPFGDVPAKHWSYEAVNKLIKDGIIDGYGDNAVPANRNLTRYEMAQMVARAVWNTEKANADQKIMIDKLSAEFQDELDNLGVHGKKAESKDEKFHLFGVLHLADQSWNNSGVFKTTQSDSTAINGGHVADFGVDLFLKYKVNDAWSVHIEQEAVRSFRTGSYGDHGTSVQGIVLGNQYNDQMYAQGRVGATEITFGKWDYIPAYGAVMNRSDRAVNGIQFGFGDQVKTKLTYGWLRQNHTGAPLNANLISDDVENHYAAAEVNVPLSPDSNFKAAYHNITNNGNGGTFSDNMKLWEAGFDTRLAKDLQIYATYEKSNADTDNKEWIVGLNYKHAKLDVPNSYGLNLRYLYMEPNATVGPTNDWWISGSTYGHGLKGLQFHSQYMLDTNIDVMVWAGALKTTDGTDGKLQTIKVCIDYFF